MNPRELRETLARAADAVTGSRISVAQASRTREGWRIWRALWVELERKPPADRMLTVCMYCERLHASTGEWAATPPGLAEMLHSPKLIQVTHGVCPVCPRRQVGRTHELIQHRHPSEYRSTARKSPG